MNRVKRISGRTGLVLAGLLVGLSLCEIMIRIGVCLSSGLHATVNFGEVNQFSEHKNFESYLKTQGVHIRPHQEWRGYWTNSLGFYDREFEIHKPDNLLRILSLGDSFCYGMVPYTENVQTLLEERLNFWSETVDIEVLNCGVAATGVEDYQKLYHYAESRFNPDVVLLHFYLGNDGPDPFQQYETTVRETSRFRSYLWLLIRNQIRISRAVEKSNMLSHNDDANVRGEVAVGGTRLSNSPDYSDVHPEIAGPRFKEEAFEEICMVEAWRFYSKRTNSDESWSGILDNISKIHEEAISNGQMFSIVLYPSLLQMDGDLFRRSVQAACDTSPMLAVPDDFNQSYPNRVLKDFCDSQDISCLDLTQSLRKEHRRSLKPFYTSRDTHWNILGNQTASEVEAQLVSEWLSHRVEQNAKSQSTISN
ncbi:MAG: SGNH/GDSL hydrolase family protein [Planctomicrobium sp.]|nr:SGNH/GDSL hydrolase family protein [Planctomicrobium sp.]